jgi:hypothetical protein
MTAPSSRPQLCQTKFFATILCEVASPSPLTDPIAGDGRAARRLTQLLRRNR